MSARFHGPLDLDAPLGACAQGHSMRQHASVTRWLVGRAACLRCGDRPSGSYGPGGRRCGWCATRGWLAAGPPRRLRRLACPDCLSESLPLRLRAWLLRWPALEDAP